MKRHILSIICSALLAVAAFAQGGGVDPSFHPGTGGNDAVITSVIQPDGKIIIGGDFTAYNGTARVRMARITADGSLDASFNPGSGANGMINAALLQADGKIIIGGDFTSYNGTARVRMARLNADGSLDNTFNPGVGADMSVRTIAQQADGKVIIGGEFATFDGTARNGIARLNTNGGLDASFNPVTASGTWIYALVAQADGKVVIGGDFTSGGAITSNYIARLNADGTADNSFAPGSGTNFNIYAMVQQSGGKLIIAGHFSNFNGAYRPYIARLLSNGNLDTTFDPGDGPDQLVNSLALQADGKILIGGDFTNYDNSPVEKLTRILPNGTWDRTFSPGVGANSSVYTISVQADGNIIIVGAFTNYDGTACGRITRVLPIDNQNRSFDPGSGTSGAVYTSTGTDDGVILGGDFSTYNDTASNGLVKVGPTGKRIPGFTAPPSIQLPVRSVVPAPNGNALVISRGAGDPNVNSLRQIDNNGNLDAVFNPAEAFYKATSARLSAPLVGGAPSAGPGAFSGLAMLAPDGSEDPSFEASIGLTDTVETILELPDSTILVGGSIATLNGAPARPLELIRRDGQKVPFNVGGSGPNGKVVAAMPRIPVGSPPAAPGTAQTIIVGEFTTYNDVPRNGIAVLNADGSLDGSFNPASTISGKILTVAPYDASSSIGGGQYNMVVGGNFSTTSGGTSNIAVLRPDGSLDPTFQLGGGADNTVHTISMFEGSGGDARARALNISAVGGAFDFVGGSTTSSTNTGSVVLPVDDCLGVSGGTNLPGSSCDDGDPTTGNDTYGADCICLGLALDCEGVPGGTATVGTACDDGDANTANDAYDANCNCVGQAFDCLGVPGGTATVGSSCDDGDANTGNDVYGADCVCAGGPAPDFIVSCTYGSCDNTVTVCNSWVGVTTLSVNAINGFNEPITVSVSGAPSWLTSSSYSDFATPYPDFNHIRPNVEMDFVPGTYTYDIVLTSVPSGITHSMTVTTTFNNPVPLSCGGPYGPFSTLDGPVTLNGSPMGFWSGTGVNDDTFVPATAGAGTHELTFYPFGEVACSPSCTTTITVSAPPAPDCEGVPGGTATVGTPCDDGNANTVNDVYGADCVCAGGPAPDFSVGCVYSSCDMTVTVCGSWVGITTLGVSAINGFNEHIAVSLSGAPSWLTFNDSYSDFWPPYPSWHHIRPDVASNFVPGTYTYDVVLTSVPSGITHSFTTTTTFQEPIPISCGGPYGPFSTLDGPVTLNGSPMGYWSGTGVNGDTFEPATAGAGTHQLTFFAFGEEACSAYCTAMITVSAPPAPDCEGVPGGTATVGTPCDDGNANTVNDTYDANCNCVGTATGSCTGNEVVVAITTDSNPGQLTWEVLDASNAVIATGGPSAGQANMLVSGTVCLGGSPTSACYGFRLMDSFGDGITNGGWELRTTDGKLLLRDAFAGSFASPANPAANPSYGSAHSFCLPTGPANIAPTECGIFNNLLGNKVYANKVTGAANYQFEFSDPDAGFMRRIARPYNYVLFGDMVTNPLVPGVKYFARVRTDRDGAMLDAHFGSGCEMGIGLAAVPCTQLIPAPAYGHSCNETRTFNTNNSFIYATPVQGATEYQFRIFNTQEGYDQSFTRSTYILQLKWNSTVAPPLINGYTYQVEMNVKVNSVYSGFCASTCNITIDNSANRPEARVAEMEDVPAFNLWPNPNHGERLYITMDGLDNTLLAVNMDLFDLTGRVVFSSTLPVAEGQLNSVLDLNNAASGAYLLQVTAGDKTYNKRVIVQK